MAIFAATVATVTHTLATLTATPIATTPITTATATAATGSLHGTGIFSRLRRAASFQQPASQPASFQYPSRKWAKIQR